MASAVQSRFPWPAGGIFLRRLGALDFFQTALGFGATLLLSALPFVILVSSLANRQIDSDLSRHIGLNPEGADIVSELFAASPPHSAAAVVTALILAAAGTMAVAGSLQAIYERSFGQEHRGWRDAFRYFIWVAVLLGAFVAESAISGTVYHGLGPVGRTFFSYLVAAAVSWWTMHFLLAGRVRWRMLVRTAMVTALLWVMLELVSPAYFSQAIISDSRIYGKIGVVFSLLTWFIAIGAVLVIGTAAGATWEERRGRLGGPGDGIPDDRTGEGGRRDTRGGSRPPADYR
jgi:membrane protein